MYLYDLNFGAHISSSQALVHSLLSSDLIISTYVRQLLVSAFLLCNAKTKTHTHTPISRDRRRRKSISDEAANTQHEAQRNKKIIYLATIIYNDQFYSFTIL